MPICVVGAPHSGISAVAAALRTLEVDLGPEPGLNEAGAPDQCSTRFAHLHESVLEIIGTTWRAAPAPGAWKRRREIQSLVQEAHALAGALALVEPWGWADPRSTLTLPFWREVFPSLDVVVCIRHPAEVAAAFDATGALSAQEGLELWHAYYQGIELRGDCTVVDLSASTEASPSVVKRIADALGLSGAILRAAHSNEGLVEASGAAHHGSDILPHDAQILYADLAALAMREKPDSAMARESRNDDVLAAQKQEIIHLRRELERLRGRLGALAVEIESHAGWQRERDELLANLETQLLERDEELRRARAENEWRKSTEASLTEGIEWLRKNERDLRTQLGELRSQLGTMQQTRLWRVGASYWRLKDVLGTIIHRRR